MQCTPLCACEVFANCVGEVVLLNSRSFWSRTCEAIGEQRAGAAWRWDVKTPMHFF